MSKVSNTSERLQEALIEHIKAKSENGIATAEAMGNEVAEIFDNVKLKNS